MRRANVRFNYHDYLLLPEDKRYEILDGELYEVKTPNTRHQTVLGQMMCPLFHHTRDMKLGELLLGPCDVILSDENIVQPDILFVSKERRGIIGEANISGPPDLVIEILSPSSRSKDLEVKRKLYASFGVREYWIVDPEAETLDVLVWSEQGYTSAGNRGRSERLSSPVLPELDIQISLFFETK
jgi:Uma2 family endonuclease